MAKRLWTPKLDLPTVVAWWDANQGVAITSGNVTSWTDQINGLVATGDSGSQPTFQASARNGTPGLVFNDNLLLTFNPATFCEVNLTTCVSAYLNTPVSGWKRVFSFGNSDNTSSFQIIRRGSDNSAGEITIGVAANVDWSGADRCVIATKSGADGSVYVDGTFATSRTAFENSISGTQGYIGRGQGYADWWPGIIQQIVFCRSALADADRQNLEGWESWYTGKNGANLPANHPYKSAAPTVGKNRRRPQLLIAS